MHSNPLGNKTEYKPYYDATLLFPIERVEGRSEFGIADSACIGYDRWLCYEMSWLGTNGKPEVRTVRIVYPASSACIIESKSLKLYLGSFTMTRFASEAAVAETISRDLRAIVGADWIDVQFFLPQLEFPTQTFEGHTLVDSAAVECSIFQPDRSLLEFDQRDTSSQPVLSKLYSNLLKTNCPMTGQPDWATLAIEYCSTRILRPESLLRYVVSYREHGGYHEVCCEEIFCDLMSVLQPEMLSVACYFTRRGGIDITPRRFFGTSPDTDWSARAWRQ